MDQVLEDMGDKEHWSVLSIDNGLILSDSVMDEEPDTQTLACALKQMAHFQDVDMTSGTLETTEQGLSTQLQLTLNINGEVSRGAANLLPSPLNTQPT